MEKDYYIIFIPGLLETSLNLGIKEVWPIENIKYLYFIFKHFLNIDINYKEIFDNIFNPNIEKGKYINKNRKFITDYLSKKSINDFSIFTYDWTLGIEELSNVFIKFVEKIETNKEIQIIGYSYGGLIGYYSLSQKDNFKNLSKVKSFISVATPFKGSIKATSLIFGTDGHDNNYKLIKDYIHHPKFQSIYDLIISYPIMVFLDENNKQIDIDRIESIFSNHELINKDKLKKSIETRKILNNVSLIDIEFKCFIGNDAHSYIPQFFKVNENNKINIIYDKACSDGVVSLYEALPDYDEKELSSNFTIHYINATHTSILDSDELLNKLQLNIDTKNGFIFIDVSESTKNTLKLTFKINISNNIYDIKKITAKNLFLTHNSNKMNLNDKIISKNNTSYIIVNDEYYFGVISLSKGKITYVNELNENKEYKIKRLQIKYET